MSAAGGRGKIQSGHKLVVQLTPTVSAKKGVPVFVENLDATLMAQQGLFELPPVMIYGEDITHIVTEKGIAYLCRCGSPEERRAAIRAVASRTPVGEEEIASETEVLRQKRAVAYPEDLNIQPEMVSRDMLAAKNMQDLVKISGKLYRPPLKFL